MKYESTGVINFISKVILTRKRSKKFNDIFLRNEWASQESYSGSGSTKKNTEFLVKELNSTLLKLNIQSVLDIPCGDFNWISEALPAHVRYIGGDISKDLIRKLQRSDYPKNISFKKLDICRDKLPESDMVFIRDCFVHLSFEDIELAIRNLQKSKIGYFALTSFTSRTKNQDSKTGMDWRPLNMQLHPFNFPKPLINIDEKCTEGEGKFLDKSICIWSKEQLF